MKVIFTRGFLKEIGFEFTSGDEISKYGEAASIRPKGMKIINWNIEGHSCTYFGDKLEPNVSVSIKTDGGTRTLFNGYVYSQDDVRKIISLTL